VADCEPHLLALLLALLVGALSEVDILPWNCKQAQASKQVSTTMGQHMHQILLTRAMNALFLPPCWLIVASLFGCQLKMTARTCARSFCSTNEKKTEEKLARRGT
jgi:hypothetical protein